MTMRTFCLALVVASAFFACSEDKVCQDGTVFLTIDLSAAPAGVDAVRVGVTNPGRPYGTQVLTRRPGSQTESVAVAFASGYPAGATLAIDVTGLAGGAEVASTVAQIAAAPGCTAATITLTTNVQTDGSMGGMVGNAEASSCAAGERRCDDRVVSTCSAGGVWVESEECPFRCESGACAGCESGTSRCTPEGARTCSPDGTWGPAQACAAGCEGGACITCTAGSTRCQGKGFETCGPTGWGGFMACPFACVAGACAGDCEAGQMQCKDKTLQSCSTEGSWADVVTCPFVCDAGACKGVCVPGSKQCSGNVVQLCSAAGAWQDQSTCEFACVDGACTAKMPGKPGVAPTIVSISPADGSKVREKDTIVIVFSEEMDVTSVEAAWKPNAASAPKPTFTWSADKTVVKVDPKFAYPAGTDVSVPRGTYGFSVLTTAKDANGEALAAPAARSYPLAYRRITTRLPFAQNEPGGGYASGNANNVDSGIGTWLMVGFNGADGRTDGFATFYMDPLPANIVTVEKATLPTAVEVVYGSATGLGNLRVADITYPVPFKSTAFDLTFARIGAPVPAAGLFTVGAKASFDVTSALVADYRDRVARGNRTQYRFLFDGSVPANNMTRHAIRLLRSSTSVDVVYLID